MGDHPLCPSLCLPPAPSSTFSVQQGRSLATARGNTEGHENGSVALDLYPLVLTRPRAQTSPPPPHRTTSENIAPRSPARPASVAVYLAHAVGAGAKLPRDDALPVDHLVVSPVEGRLTTVVASHIDRQVRCQVGQNMACGRAGAGGDDVFQLTCLRPTLEASWHTCIRLRR